MPHFEITRRHSFIVEADTQAEAEALTQESEPFWISERRGKNVTAHAQEVTLASQIDDELADAPAANGYEEDQVKGALV